VAIVGDIGAIIVIVAFNSGGSGHPKEGDA
jgi:hypothetical protein